MPLLVIEGHRKVQDEEGHGRGGLARQEGWELGKAGLHVGPEEIRQEVLATDLTGLILFHPWPCELCFQRTGVL